jgi:acetyl esterase
MPLDPNVAKFLTMVESFGLPAMSEGTPETARAGLRTLMVDMVDPSTFAQVASVEPLTIGEIPARVYRPSAAAAKLPTIVYLHGGGFVIGDLDTHDGVCRRLCHDVEAVVVSVDYALAPEHRFPRAVEDSWAALQHVAAHIDDFGGDAGRLAVGGDSAGGNLAAVCAQLAHANGVDLAAQLLVYPAVDLLGDYPSREENAEGYFLTLDDMQWFAENYVGLKEDDPQIATVATDVRLSPLLAPSLVGLAPAVLVTAEFDPLRDEGNRYAAALADAGVQVEHQQFAGLIHGFYGAEHLSPAIEDATAWTNATLKKLLG